MGYQADEIFGELFENAPEHLRNDEHFQNVAHTVYAWADEFDNWIDPNSDYYAERLWEAGQEGVTATKDALFAILCEARYRRDMFGEAFDLDAFADMVYKFEIEPDMGSVY